MRNRKGRNFRFEMLEGRACLAAAASVTTGNLTITDDVAADLVVTQTAADTWTVTDGGNPVGAGTFTGVTGNVTIKTSAADDSIAVVLTGQTAPKCVIVDAKGGANEVSVTGGTIAQTLDLKAGAGDDTFTVDGVTVNGLTQINTGNGNNTLVLSNGGSKSLHIVTGSGDDTTTIGDGTSPYSVTGTTRINDNGGPNDVVTVASGATLGNLQTTAVNSLTLAAGSDLTGSVSFSGGYNTANQLTLEGTVDGSIYMYGSGGTDTLTSTAGSVVGGSVSAYSSSGDDNFDLAGTILGSAYLDTGAGIDAVTLGGQVGNRVWAWLGSGADFFELTGKIGVAPGTTSRLTLDAGTGNDQVALRAGSEVNGTATINMGAGDDELAVDDTALIIAALFSGGSGSDKYYGTLPRTGVTQVSLETLLVIAPPF